MKIAELTNRLQDICHSGDSEKEVKVSVNGVLLSVISVIINDESVELVLGET